MSLRILVNLLHAPPSLTGTGWYAYHLLREMARLPEQPRLTGICSPFNREAFAPLEPVVRLVEWGSSWESVTARRLQEWAFLHGAIRRARPDVFWGPSNFLPLRRVCPCVATIHDMTFFSHPETLPALRRRYWHAWTRRTIKVADHILTVSAAAKADIEHYGGVRSDRITVVHNGTGAEFFIAEDDAGRAARLQELRAAYPDLPERYVFFLGTLAAHKNVPRLVEAVAEARRRGCADMQLVMAGKPGTGYDEVRAAIDDNGLRDAVHELGYTPAALLPALYENARVHVLPSVTEGFGLPITEAMAAGTPVLTTDSGATAEVAGEAGLLVPPNDTPAMADALARVWHDEALYADLRKRGIARAQQFTWQRAARRTFDVLRQHARADDLISPPGRTE